MTDDVEPVASLDVVALRTTLRTLQALASSPELLHNLDARQRLAITDAARILSGRPARAPRPPRPPLPPVPAPTPTVRPCYVCGVSTVVEVDALCASCRLGEQAASQALTKATLNQVLKDRVVVVTGGRVNIGFATALAALRLGARVLLTTRFVDDARLRFGSCFDVDLWRDRLELFGLDLRDLPAIEGFAAHLDATHPEGIDAILHNAAQTLPLSNAARRALSQTTLALPSSASTQPSSADALVSVLAPAGLVVTAEDAGPYGCAPDASWQARVEDVSTRELLEVLLVNAAAPFVLTRALLPLLRRSPRRPRVIVNVTSSEGRFSFSHQQDADADGAFAPLDSAVRGERRGKSPRHPHLNMAKAALNMLTRTSAVEFAKDDIVLVAVDPGWVSGPLPVGGFANGRFPLDADEAARRVLHPLLEAVGGSAPLAGVLYKNYRPSPW